MVARKIAGIVLFFALITSTGCANLFDSESEVTIQSETNRVRTFPKKYASKLMTELRLNRRAWNQTPAGRVRIAEYEEAIRTLNSTRALRPLYLDDGLSRAALDHAEDLIEHNRFSHAGSDGSSPGVRIQRHGSYAYPHGENIIAGYNPVESAVLGWVLSPGHLANILNPRYTLIGTAYIPGHQRYNWVGVQKFAGGRN